ncbi:lytic transglycosylase domain-containing protein [Desulfoluna sp.]|uniref:lytic transglycosylase domain-containing protein n=1 Tax=Desulfoluna sp. TaxID=2045199 RepID=UPI00262ADE20|nr:lytic transglycosylase domain-containing protein [Desulfoluna sp.]
MRPKGWILCLALVVWAPAGAEIYTYKDASGQIYFTDSPGAHEIDIMGARRLDRHKKGGSPKLWSSSAFDPLIVKAAAKHNLPFALIKAVIHAESAFNPKALSPKGAKGLMQLMPQNIAFYKIKNPFDPDENIMGGAAYLKLLLTDFKGNRKLALAAYNAGPTKVKECQGVPPIAETRAYVAKVERFNRYYSLN